MTGYHFPNFAEVYTSKYSAVRNWGNGNLSPFFPEDMTELTIATSEDRTAYQPGEEVMGDVHWKLDKPEGVLELRLFWFTRGKGVEDAGVVETVRFDRPQQEETRTFRFRLPDSPYSFSGKLISLVWALELVAEPAKDVHRLEITMAPGGKEIQLGSV